MEGMELALVPVGRARLGRGVGRRLWALPLAVVAVVVSVALIPRPARSEPDFGQIAVLIEQRDFPRAETELGQLERDHAGDPRLAQLRGRLLAARAKGELEQGAVPEAARLYNSSDAVRFAPIRTLIDAGRWAEAQAAIVALPPIDRASATIRLYQTEVWIGLGEFHYQRRECQAALEHFQQAYRSWPGHPVVRARYTELTTNFQACVNEATARAQAAEQAFLARQAWAARQAQLAAQPNPALPTEGAAGAVNGAILRAPGLTVYVVDAESQAIVQRIREGLRAAEREAAHAGAPGQGPASHQGSPYAGRAIGLTDSLLAAVIGLLLIVSIQLAVLNRRLRRRP